MPELPEVVICHQRQLEEISGFRYLLSAATSEVKGLVSASEIVVRRYAELLLLLILRDHFHRSGCPGQIAPRICDQQIENALQAVNASPAAPWTVATLAGQANMSRSAFAERFRNVVGTSPLQYVTECRLRKAELLLRLTSLGIKQVATAVGYNSAPGFSTAFRRRFGRSPSDIRASDRG